LHEKRLNTSNPNIAPSGRPTPGMAPTASGRFTSDTVHMKAYEISQNTLWETVASSKKYQRTGQLPKSVPMTFDLNNAGTSFSLSHRGKLTAHQANRVFSLYRLDQATNQYVLRTMYPTR
jgi:hypothetical protein